MSRWPARGHHPRSKGPPGRPVSVEEYQQRLDADLLESDWQAQVVSLLMWRGFPKELIYHPHNSQRSTPGYPDLSAVRWRAEEFTLVIAELKREGEYPTGPQQRWLRELAEVAQRVNEANCGGRMLVGVWRPSDRDRLGELLA